MNNSQLRVNRMVALATTLFREAVDINPFPEQETMRRATVVEHAKLIPLVDMLALMHRDIARRDLHHPDADERHRPDGRVIRLDEDDGTGSHGAQIGLRRNHARRVDVSVVGRVARDAVPRRLGEVRAIEHVGLDDAAGHGGVPAVVAQSVQEGLVDGAADELPRQVVLIFTVVAAQHVHDGVWLLLHPELVAGLHVVLDAEGLRLARVDDDAVVVRAGDGADPRAEEAGEEVVPGLVAVVGRGWVGVEHLVEGVVGFAEVVSDGDQVAQAVWAEPVGVGGVVQHIG